MFTKISIILLLLTLHLNAVIIDAPKLSEFALEALNGDHDTLVLIDVDNTLLLAKDRILQSVVQENYSDVANSFLSDPSIILSGKLSPMEMVTQIYKKMEFEVVDPNLVWLVNSLKKKRIKTIAFTKMWSNSLGDVNLASWRIEHLKKHGFDFSKSIYHSFSFEVGYDTALYEEGVLFTNESQKGPVLAAFLEHLDWMPKKIILLDDRLDYLESVEAYIGHQTEFKGYHYREVENRNIPLDSNLASFQFLYLSQTGEWLSDSEARAYLTKS